MEEDPKSIDLFSKDLDNLIQHYALEFHLTYAEVIGTMMIKINQLSNGK